MRHRCRPPSFYGVQDVLSLRDPLQVLQVVVEPISVLMVHHQSRVNAEKRLGNKAMNITADFAGAIVAEVYPLITPVFIGFQQPWAETPTQPLNSALRRDYVALFKTNNG